MKNALLICAALIVLGFSSVIVGQDRKATSSVANRTNPIVEKAFAAWNSHDPDKVAAAYADDIVYEDVPYNVTSHGSAELRKFATETFAAVDDVKIEAVNARVENGHGVVEWVWHGIDKGLFKTGKPFAIRGVSVFEVRNGKIWRNKDFYDFATMMRQVGALPK